jgi:FADH2 O2-dependent halogenase
MDDAALHHVFDGGWMWVLRFANGVTSAGVAVEDWLAEDLKLADGEPAWHRLLARYPSVAAQFADARPTRSFTWMPRLAYRAAGAAGDRWAMLPSAAAFIDPLFSTGIPLTLVGIERLARILEDGLEQAGLKTRLYDYASATLEDADRTARFIAGSYAGFRQFPMFTAYSMFYFAAASFSEMARRLASAHTPRRFLCGDAGPFAAGLDRLSPAVWRHDDDSDYARRVASAVADWNVAGLCDSGKRNWYAVDLDDTVRGAGKLGMTPEAVRAGLELTASSSRSALV